MILGKLKRINIFFKPFNYEKILILSSIFVVFLLFPFLLGNTIVAVVDYDYVVDSDVLNKEERKRTDSLIWSAALDSKENIYGLDVNNYKVLKLNKDGVIITEWGGFGVGNGQFDFKDEKGHVYGDIAVSKDGLTIYVVDTVNNRIQKFDNNGKFVQVWGTKGKEPGKFDTPMGISLEMNDKGATTNVYVADTANHRIQKFDSQGDLKSVWGTEGDGKGMFKFPTEITVDDKRDVHVIDAGHHSIDRFDSEGKYLGTKVFEKLPTDIIYGFNKLFVAFPGSVYMYSLSYSEREYILGFEYWTLDPEEYPKISLALDPVSGNLYTLPGGNQMQELERVN